MSCSLSRLLCPWEFSRQEYRSGLSCPSPGHLPNPVTEPRSPTLQTDSLPSELPAKPMYICMYVCMCVCVYVYIYKLYQFAVPEAIITLLINYMKYKIKSLKKRKENVAPIYIHRLCWAQWKYLFSTALSTIDLGTFQLPNRDWNPWREGRSEG